MVTLVHVYDEDEVVSETTQSVHRWHSDDERKEVIDDGVQESVSEGSAWHVLNWLQSIIDVELGSHLDETEHINTSY